MFFLKIHLKVEWTSYCEKSQNPVTIVPALCSHAWPFLPALRPVVKPKNKVPGIFLRPSIILPVNDLV